MDKNLNLAVICSDYAGKIRENLRKHYHRAIKLLLLTPLLIIIPAAFATQKINIPSHADEKLPKLNLAPMITVSGLSSGGYMATQFHMAHAEAIEGAALIGSGPYFCSEGSLATAQMQCLDKKTSPPVADLVQIAKDRAHDNKLADVTKLKNARIWIFHGTEDQTVSAPVTNATVDFYKAFVPESNIVYVNNIAAGHGFPTVGEEVDCPLTEPPYINKCNYDGAGILLKHFYGTLNAPAKTTQKVKLFNQDLYSPDNSSLAQKGYVYIPQKCLDGELCKLHVSFHGCKQTAKMIGDRYVTETGFNGWAESNNLVILYPQAEVTLPANPFACWDWWGYTNENFADRSGLQIESVWKMVMALRGVKV